MPSPKYSFRLPQHLGDQLDALARRLGATPTMIAKAIVTKLLAESALLLEKHDQQLEHIFLMIKDIAHVHRDLMRDDTVRNDESTTTILARLEDIAQAVDSIRDAAFVRPSTTVEDLIAAHDEKPVQQSLST
jgi:hypothetical protein